MLLRSPHCSASAPQPCHLPGLTPRHPRPPPPPLLLLVLLLQGLPQFLWMLGTSLALTGAIVFVTVQIVSVQLLGGRAAAAPARPPKKRLATVKEGAPEAAKEGAGAKQRQGRGGGKAADGGKQAAPSSPFAAAAQAGAEGVKDE